MLKYLSIHNQKQTKPREKNQSTYSINTTEPYKYKQQSHTQNEKNSNQYMKLLPNKLRHNYYYFHTKNIKTKQI